MLDVVFVIIRWSVVITWRFFSGSHMNGRTHNDATWWQDASTFYRKRRGAYTWWRRKSRMKRASWRGCIFWPVALTTWGSIFYFWSTVIILACLSPGLSWYVGKYIRLALFMPIVARNSDGSVTQNWVLKPKVRRRWNAVIRPRGMRKRPGLALTSELRPGIRVEEIPREYRGAVISELAEELHGQPAAEMKLLMTPDDGSEVMP